MTEKLYLAQPFVETVRAKVLLSTQTENGFETELSQTVLFPEGGGQLPDKGTIDGHPVLHVREEGERVFHLTGRPLTVGQEVEVRLDIASRLDHSAQHTGEHILSGLAKTMFDAVNVGFHMAAEYVTIDLDKFLDDEALSALEREANRVVRQNVPVTSRVIDEAELTHTKLRKKAEGLSGDIRVVEVEGADSCTCCGTHLSTSGEVGAIKITASSKYKGGTRIWFACGQRATDASRKEHLALDALARRFSVKAEDVVEAVKKQGDELASLKAELKKRTETFLSLKAQALLEGAAEVNGVRRVVHAEEGLSVQELRMLSDKLSSNKTVCALFSLSGDTALYLFTRGDQVSLSMRTLCDAANALFGGKGGGRDNGAQGSAAVLSKSAFLQAVEQFEQYLTRALR